MRYLEFNHIIIDTQNQLLIRDGESIILAPKVYDLLIFFCKNPARIITKDELMDEVWTGTLVTENAISRTLVKVRKALGDDPKSPQFIITVPRKGYRMVTEFNANDKCQYNEQNTTEHTSTNKENNNTITASFSSLNSTKNKKQKTLLSLFAIYCTLLIVAVSFYFSTQQNIEIIATKQLKPLTREIADEQHPNVSPDLSQLAYTKVVSGKPSYINIENLSDHSKMSVSHPRGKLSRPVWSPTESKIAFLYQHKQVCIIFLAEQKEIKNKDNWQKITECSGESWPHLVFSPDGQYLYFNDRQSKANGYQIFRVDLLNKQKDIINQPITSGQGNYAFDISPDGQRLVMLNSEFTSQTRIYTLDIAQAKLQLTAKLPYLMGAVVWHHDNMTLVHPSPHPAYELWQSNLAGEKLAVVVSNTSRVKQLSRINNKQDFTFVSYLINRDIHFKDSNKDNQSMNLDNSSVMDYLPALANNSDQYAFVSKRSTTAEVYLAPLPTENNSVTTSKQLTFFNTPVRLFQLLFSPDDSQLMVLADNQIVIVDIDKGEVNKLALGNRAISGISWQDQHTLLFSTIRNSDWQLMQYNITTKVLTAKPNGYQGGLYDHKNQNFYFLADESNEVIKLNDLTQTPQSTGLICEPSFINRQLNLTLTPDGLVCLSDVNNNIQELKYYSFEDKSISPWQELPTSFDYQINNKGVIFTQLKQSVADIMQTKSN
ncbi:winged helix-turn-helix domain-containing protein [Colwelliaceae bacterium BS250]